MVQILHHAQFLVLLLPLKGSNKFNRTNHEQITISSAEDWQQGGPICTMTTPFQRGDRRCPKLKLIDSSAPAAPTVANQKTLFGFMVMGNAPTARWIRPHAVTGSSVLIANNYITHYPPRRGRIRRQVIRLVALAVTVVVLGGLAFTHLAFSLA